MEKGSGGQTKYNRERLGVPKRHSYDAACVGETGELINWDVPIMEVRVVGKGRYQRSITDGSGRVTRHFSRQRMIKGFKSGDYVRAEVVKGKYKGEWEGYISVRVSGYFDLKDGEGKVIAQGISWRNLHILQRSGGYVVRS